ncbi:hypothetical protein HPP92_013836 [Vanilla planifolia]|uniref:Uncharacterized protein n=1 Tax=Vanilla planifolia TaxID=51239 RepID=A0A835UYD1_VANPL|nr:hypothetical protein HPP92_013836 [Vanilla planifolia]
MDRIRSNLKDLGFTSRITMREHYVSTYGDPSMQSPLQSGGLLGNSKGADDAVYFVIVL